MHMTHDWQQGEDWEKAFKWRNRLCHIFREAGGLDLIGAQSGESLLLLFFVTSMTVKATL